MEESLKHLRLGYTDVSSALQDDSVAALVCVKQIQQFHNFNCGHKDRGNNRSFDRNSGQNATEKRLESSQYVLTQLLSHLVYLFLQ